LIQAALAGDVGMVERLLRDGRDVNVRDRTGATPLIAASVGGHLRVVELLLARGADVSAKDDGGMTALRAAAAAGMAEVAKALLARGVDAGQVRLAAQDAESLGHVSLAGDLRACSQESMPEAPETSGPSGCRE